MRAEFTDSVLSTRDPFSREDTFGNFGLVEMICDALDALDELRGLAETFAEAGNHDVLEFRPRELRALGELATNGSISLKRRAAQLNPARRFSAKGPTHDHPGGADELEPITLIRSYRACSRRLCDAMKEAIRVSDGESAAVLRTLILRLEKQLWVIDSPSRAYGVHDSRAVALFL